MRPHLGAEIAAFVDGQLDDVSRAAAEDHVASCDRCRAAVADQQRLKARMGAVRLPAPPAALHDVLFGIAQSPPRLVRSAGALPRVVFAGMTVAGVSVLVLGAAYLLGASTAQGDPVAPGYAALLAAFTPAANAGEQADGGLDNLRAHDWPCPARLGGLTRQRVSVDAESVSVFYRDAVNMLQLHEQPGRLDQSALVGVDNVTVSGTRVWVAGTNPAVVTWQAPGFVLTLITTLPRTDWRRVVAELPMVPEPTVAQRVGDGLDRMANWF